MDAERFWRQTGVSASTNMIRWIINDAACCWWMNSGFGRSIRTWKCLRKCEMWQILIYFICCDHDMTRLFKLKSRRHRCWHHCTSSSSKTRKSFKIPEFFFEKENYRHERTMFFTTRNDDNEMYSTFRSESIKFRNVTSSLCRAYAITEHPKCEWAVNDASCAQVSVIFTCEHGRQVKRTLISAIRTLFGI